MIFCVSEFQKKMNEFAASIERSKAKSVSASGGLCPPDPPTKVSAPGPCWGLHLQTPVKGSRSVRSPCPPFCQILHAPVTFNNHSLLAVTQESLYPLVGVTIHSITSQFLNQSSVANFIECFCEVQDPNVSLKTS